MTTFQERLDELLACAAHAGYLDCEAINLAARAYAKRDPRLTRRARNARKQATVAEQLLASTHARFISDFEQTP